MKILEVQNNFRGRKNREKKKRLSQRMKWSSLDGKLTYEGLRREASSEEQDIWRCMCCC